MREGRVFHKETTDSTQSDARDLVQQGKARHGDACTASFQSAGRGRVAGRIWEAEPDLSLMVTLLLEKSQLPSSPPLSLVLGLGVALTMEKKYQLRPKIKWPNDIYLQNRKCCGILCESEKTFFLCGMGVNLNQENFPAPLDQKAISLFQARGSKIKPPLFLSHLKEELEELFKRESLSILKSIEERLLWKNEEKSLLLGDPGKKDKISGVIRGIHKDGALLFESGNEIKKVYSAEFI